MKFIFQVFVIMLFSTPLIAAESDAWASKAVFADVPAPITYTNKDYSYGLVFQDLSGMGIIAKRNLSPDKHLWVEAAYKAKSKLFLDQISTSSQAAYTEVEELNRFQLMAGIDQIFHLTNNNGWGILLGLGAGYSQSDYKSKFYPRLCSIFYCGYDESSPFIKIDADNYAFILGRLGLGFRDLNISGFNSDLNFALIPNLIRWPNKFEIRDPEGNEVKLPELTSYVLELTIQI